MNSYNNKILTISLSSINEALKVMDNISYAGISPIMYLYDDAKQILDNVEP